MSHVVIAKVTGYGALSLVFKSLHELTSAQFLFNFDEMSTNCQFRWIIFFYSHFLNSLRRKF